MTTGTNPVPSRRPKGTGSSFSSYRGGVKPYRHGPLSLELARIVGRPLPDVLAELVDVDSDEHRAELVPFFEELERQIEDMMPSFVEHAPDEVVAHMLDREIIPLHSDGVGNFLCAAQSMTDEMAILLDHETGGFEQTSIDVRWLLSPHWSIDGTLVITRSALPQLSVQKPIRRAEWKELVADHPRLQPRDRIAVPNPFRPNESMTIATPGRVFVDDTSVGFDLSQGRLVTSLRGSRELAEELASTFGATIHVDHPYRVIPVATPSLLHRIRAWFRR